MDITRIERRLKKIVTVVETIKEDNRITTIEKDLLLSYIRELYDVVREGEEGVMEVKTDSYPKIEQTKISPVETPQVRVEQPKKVEAAVVSPVKEIEAPPPPQPKEIERPVVVEEKSDVEVTWDKEMDNLFAEEAATDLSEKLAMTPIKDIGKAMGINERIFTISELFNKDEAVFSNTVFELNHLNDFESAKQLLLNAAYKYGWAKEDKQKKAMQFIKTVRRRYTK